MERFPLQKQCTSRHVSFTMYDWPEAHASTGIFPSLGDLPVKSTGNMFFPCQVTDKNPVIARELVKAWDKRIDDHVFSKGGITWTFGAVVQQPRATSGVFLLDKVGRKTVDIVYKMGSAKKTITTKIIIFATGIGVERSVQGGKTSAAPYLPPPFWSDLPNPPWENEKDFSNETVVLSGAGDGAIQDFLKVVFREQAKDLLLLVKKCGLTPKQLASIVSAERHVSRQLLWETSGSEAHAALQAVYDEIVEKLLKRPKSPIDLAPMLEICPKIVWVASTADTTRKRIVFSKCYALNRFLATLTLAMLRDSPKLKLIAGKVTQVDVAPDASYVCETSAGLICSIFPPLLRHGVDKSYGLGNNSGYFSLRMALAGAPLPFKPSNFPVLGPEI